MLRIFAGDYEKYMEPNLGLAMKTYSLICISEEDSIEELHADISYKDQLRLT